MLLNIFKRSKKHKQKERFKLAIKQKKKIMIIFGTRPEAIKMAPLIKQMYKYKELQPIVCITSQHREMLDQVLHFFKIDPDYDLNLMKPRQSLTDLTHRALKGVSQLVEQELPDLVLVHGDTTTAFISSLAAYYHQVPVGHVEAGLRTNNKFSPFPEEINRQLIGVLADLHFAPTNGTAENLRMENKLESNIFITGNTVIDAIKSTVQKNYRHPIMDWIGSRKMLLLTAHRRENLGKPIRRIFSSVLTLLNKHPDIVVVYPVHLNPAVQDAANDILAGHERIRLIPPLDIMDFHNFMSSSHIILTDSGGIQEEAPSMGVPVLVLRETTERPEGVAAGTLKLVGTDPDKLIKAVDKLLTNRNEYETMSKASNPYGDGEASRRICEAILYHFGISQQRPESFN